MRKVLLAILSFLLFFEGVKAEPIKLSNLAESYYMKGDYNTSFHLYDSLIHLGFSSRDLYFNAANAAYKSGKKGWSVYYYEKALREDSKDQQIKKNLSLVSSTLQDEIEPVSEIFFITLWKSSLVWLPIDIAAKVSIVLIWLAAFSFAFYLLFKSESSKRLGLIMAVFFLMLAGTFETHAALHKKWHNANLECIIMPTEVSIYSSPDLISNVLFKLHEGTKILASDKVNNWYYIKVQDGREGWIKAESVQIID